MESLNDFGSNYFRFDCVSMFYVFDSFPPVNAPLQRVSRGKKKRYTQGTRYYILGLIVPFAMQI